MRGAPFMILIKMIVKEIMIMLMIVMMMMMMIIITIILLIIVKSHILFRSTHSNSSVSTERKIRYPGLELQSKFSRHCLSCSARSRSLRRARWLVSVLWEFIQLHRVSKQWRTGHEKVTYTSCLGVS